jgi:hypothetical protein
VAVGEIDRVEFIVMTVVAVIDDMVAIGRVGRLAVACIVVGDLDGLVENFRVFTEADLIDLVVPSGWLSAHRIVAKPQTQGNSGSMPYSQRAASTA